MVLLAKKINFKNRQMVIKSSYIIRIIQVKLMWNDLTIWKRGFIRDWEGAYRFRTGAVPCNLYIHCDLWAKFRNQTNVTVEISSRRVPRGKVRESPPLDWKSIIRTNGGTIRGLPPSRDRVGKKYIFSLRAGNNYVVEHAKRYPSFLRAITKKFDWLAVFESDFLHRLSEYAKTISIS